MKLRKRVFPVRLKNCVINEKNVPATKFRVKRDRGLHRYLTFSVTFPLPSFLPALIFLRYPRTKATAVNRALAARKLEEYRESNTPRSDRLPPAGSVQLAPEKRGVLLEMKDRRVREIYQERSSNPRCILGAG